MKNKFNLGVEISESVLNTGVPDTIKRYSNIEKKTMKKNVTNNTKIYRYRPGVNSYMIGDLDV